jgi:hypothetical protein
MRINLDIDERQVVRLWQAAARRMALVSTDGEPIMVLYPGRPNDGPGADFRDAVIVRGGVLRRGDIEVHVRSNSWWEHRHHVDRAYNRVVLHIALWQDEAAPIRVQNGGRVPLVVLDRYLDNNGGASSYSAFCGVINLPCREAGKRLSSETVAGILDDAGERRFNRKAGQLQSEIAVYGSGQCLYQNIMVALGYSRNKRQFLELARRLPLTRLESLSQGAYDVRDYLVRLQGVLLGTAGLLPSQRPGFTDGEVGEEWLKHLEKVSGDLRPHSVMSRRDWCLFKVRPHNHPVRRLLAMSHLIYRFRREGLQKGIINIMKKAVLDRDERKLESSLNVACGGYWAWHRDFDLVLGRPCSTLLGRERTAEMIVNVLLPFLFIQGRSVSQPARGEETLELYHSYHMLSFNSVTRHMMAQLGLDEGLVNSARRQQGLIHLYRNYCIRGTCATCELKTDH